MHKTKRVRLVPTGLFDGEAIEADIDIKLDFGVMEAWDSDFLLLPRLSGHKEQVSQRASRY
jgi:hypothetical protein